MANPLELPWKRNLRRLPDRALAALELQRRGAGGLIVAALAKQIEKSDVASGRYTHIGISMGADGEVVIPERTMPHPQAGRYSMWNIMGRVVTRRDLPKVEKSWSWICPVFGDWSKGSFLQSRSRLVYPQETTPAENLELLIVRLKASETSCVMKFSIGPAINPKDANAEQQLLRLMNLLQENLGASGVFPSEAGEGDYLRTLNVGWELIPVGSRHEVMAKVFQGKAYFDDEARRRASERYDLLDGLNPLDYVTGNSGFQRYFGARFSDQLVVFENLAWGNAVYVMAEGWQELSQLSRGDLLQNYLDRVVRVPHRLGWEDRLKSIVQDRR